MNPKFVRELSLGTRVKKIRAIMNGPIVVVPAGCMGTVTSLDSPFVIISFDDPFISNINFIRIHGDAYLANEELIVMSDVEGEKAFVPDTIPVPQSLTKWLKQVRNVRPE